MEIMRKTRALVVNMRATGAYHEERLCPRAFVRAFYKGRLILRFDDEDDGRIIAAAGLWPTLVSSTIELGTLYVDSIYAGNGVGREVFAEAMQCVPRGVSCVFTIMRDPRAIRIASESGFQSACLGDAEVRSWAASAGILERLPKEGDGRHLLVLRP